MQGQELQNGRLGSSHPASQIKTKQHLSPAFNPGAFTILVKGTSVQGCLPESVTLVLISTLLALPGPQQVSLCCLRGGLEAGLSTAATRSHPPPENALMAPSLSEVSTHIVGTKTLSAWYGTLSRRCLDRPVGCMRGPKTVAQRPLLPDGVSWVGGSSVFMGSPFPRSEVCMPSRSQNRPTSCFSWKGSLGSLCEQPQWAVLRFLPERPAILRCLSCLG